LWTHSHWHRDFHKDTGCTHYHSGLGRCSSSIVLRQGTRRRTSQATDPDTDHHRFGRLALTMTTIPSRLARPAFKSVDRRQQAFRVRELYRDWYRSVGHPNLRIPPFRLNIAILPPQAPEMCALYALNVSPTTVRRAIRQQFDQNLHIEDPNAIERLILKGRQSYQETMNCWMQVCLTFEYSR